jgi:ubiquinone/menaquinone biosynthesis C-methylase UbiE
MDYGCGSGIYVGLWRDVFPGADLKFCDISSVALDGLVEKYPEYKSSVFLVKDNRAEYADESFDAVVSVEVMEHVEDLDAHLKDIYRLLKPGGVFVWTTPCSNALSIEHVFNVLTNNIEKTKDGNIRWKWEDPGHLRRLKSGEIKKKLLELGFDDVRFRFRSHFFSLVSVPFCRPRTMNFAKNLLMLDYKLFRAIPNGAAMIGCARKGK